MMTLKSVALSLCGITAAALAACSSSTATPASSGQALVQSSACASCHGANLAGDITGMNTGVAHVYAQNLTPDPDTGIGLWTDSEVEAAITSGVAKDGKTPLCSQMERYKSFSATDVSNIVAYLRSLPPVKQSVPVNQCGVADAGADAK